MISFIKSKGAACAAFAVLAAFLAIAQDARASNTVSVEVTQSSRMGILGQDELGSSLSGASSDLQGDRSSLAGQKAATGSSGSSLSSAGASLSGNSGSSLTGSGSTLEGEAHDLGGLITDLGARLTERGEIVVVMASDVFFDFDKDTLKPEAQLTLAKVARLIAIKKPRATRIEGHTDSKGSDDYNYRLSLRRAESVKYWLTTNGSVPGDELITKGFGEDVPTVPNTQPDGSDDPEGRAKNRRVEITLMP